MRISDWSSDVCSSDLLTEQAVRTRGFGDGGPTFVGGAGDATIAFLRDFDLGFRIRRLRLVARRLSERSEEHTSELQSLMRISYAVFCLKKKTTIITTNHTPLRY